MLYFFPLYYIPFIYSPVEVHLDCFHFFTTINNAEMNNLINSSQWYV